MNRRALLIALVVGALGLVLLVLYQRRFELEASGGDKIKLLIAVKRLERGKPITDDMISVREVPLAYVDDRAIRESDKNKILGLRLGTTVKEQQLVLWTDLTTGSDDRKDLSALVLPGYRAVAIRAARDESSVSLIRPGDYVDVIGVLGAAGSDVKTSVVLLQRVLVLALGGETSPDAIDQHAGARSFDNLLTLSLTLTEAQILALASERGRLSVAVRHPDDQQKAGVTDINFDAILDAKKRGEIRGIRPSGPVNITGGGQ
ncbi:Flp pilus assembly protein RcpC/CpaB [Labilithrix luteola]|uniref:Flp pilus assembly protein RcpC/CpaB n=1 Tax=Labilithrix luteola TaxID=1391654 RepID=A0A0K1PLQ8_9BACT|nr:Flp pilus assembly protein CpaB [Labilithrix luteola]AKU94460.1 Flp pilus assembly protein RcpC/CpaB [Labilithrix luteola]